MVERDREVGDGITDAMRDVKDKAKRIAASLSGAPQRQREARAVQQRSAVVDLREDLGGRPRTAHRKPTRPRRVAMLMASTATATRPLVPQTPRTDPPAEPRTAVPPVGASAGRS